MTMSRTANEALERMAEKASELGLDYEPDDGPLTDQQIEQVKKTSKNKPVAWTRTDVYAPIVKEEVMLKHPELRQYYPTPLYYAPQEWYIVEKWVAGERRSHIRLGESLDAVYNEEVAAGVDVINVITV